jgi:hypothetical protein
VVGHLPTKSKTLNSNPSTNTRKEGEEREGGTKKGERFKIKKNRKFTIW